jgi:hypothetical protein
VSQAIPKHIHNLETIPGLNMQTTLIGQKRNSNMQEMGETREPMAQDCWGDANRLAEMYAKKMNRDFWVLFAAKPHQSQENALVMGWEVIAKRPPKAMVGVMVFKWNNQEKRLMVEADLSLPFDVPLSETELSHDSKDVIATVGEAAKKSGSILLA